MNERLSSSLANLPDYLGQHVLLSASALLLALAVSLPLAIAAARSPALRGPIIGIASLVQTIPGLALMALFYPLLLALSMLLEPALGWKLPALGFLPALMALTLYALLPVLRNAVAGIEGIDPAVKQAALAVGMTRSQLLWQVEAPLAAPVIMAGIRTAAVWTIGAATLATPVGQTSLGNYIFSGLQTENWVSVLFGCAISAALALSVDALLGCVEAGIRQRRRTLVFGSLAILCAGIAVALAPLMVRGSAQQRIVIGAKNFSEQFILADLVASHLEKAGFNTQQKQGLGSAIAFRALAGNEIDVYVDYSGTLWTNVLQRGDMPSRAIMHRELTAQLRERFGVAVLGQLGFENAYALVMKEERAKALNITSIDDVASQARTMTFGTDLEFLERPEWKELRESYGLQFQSTRTFAPTFMYRALAGGEADVITGFSSDGRIAAENLRVLEDRKGAIPAYDALILVSPRRAGDARFMDALKPLIGSIKVEAMRAANYAVDRDADKLTPAQAAAILAR